MRKHWETGVWAKLSVFHDGQFWVGVFERVEAGRLTACRVAFGAEPSCEELFEFVVKRYEALDFSTEIETCGMTKPPRNPKRREREARKEAARSCRASTRTQAAFAEQRALQAGELKRSAESRREAHAEEKRLKLVAKRKRHHRGH